MKKLTRFSAFLVSNLLISLALSSSASAQTIVCLETDLADVCMELLETEAPDTAQNFLSYLNRGTYRSSFFHESVNDGDNTYIQAGGFVLTGLAGLQGIQAVTTSAAISNEISISNTRGTVAMVPDDPNNPDSTTSQFLINITDNPALDTLNGGYTVFARIIGGGMDFVDFISTSATISLNDGDLPLVPVITQQIPATDSAGFEIVDAFVFNGDIDDFLSSLDGDDPGDGDGSGDGGDTPTPGDGEVLFEDAVCVDTNVGEFCLELFPDITPITVANFLNYANSGRYDDTIVHRSVPGFVIQGGGYEASPLGTSITRDNTIQNEFNRSNLRGTIAMARLGGQVNSATSEWFVNLANNANLDSVDGGFTVFGEVVSGMDVVDAIAALPRVNLQTSLGSPFGELPVTDQDSDGVGSDDVVLVHRIYVTDLVADGPVDDGSGGGSGDGDGDGDGGNDVVTTTQYSLTSNSFILPVWIGETLYRVRMFQTQANDILFSVNTTTIIELADTGQDSATMDLDSGVLSIPSVQVGNVVITDVIFNLTDFSTLTFRLESFNRE
ncbi:MAG: peptidylprolyl isomerase [Gammaproteobacteria bacterium]|nr:peptidylprolyl isomerase [Gammaproteobacteria bacterium]